METFKPISKYSTIEIMPLTTGFKLDGKIIQVGFVNEFIFIEKINQEDLQKYYAEKIDNSKESCENKKDEKLEEALNTVLNTDPFCFGYEGKKLGEIFEIDKTGEWVKKALEKMKNEYIVKRIKLINEWRLLNNGNCENSNGREAYKN